MRLFEAILDANRRAVAGDTSAGVRVADFTDELPVIAKKDEPPPNANPLAPAGSYKPKTRFSQVKPLPPVAERAKPMIRPTPVLTNPAPK